MADLKRKIRDLGNVNVNAIEEYREVSERFTFLSTQRADIQKAEAALLKIIEQLDTGMRRQFRDQFERIAQEFDNTFKQLFGGGTGTLELMEDEDILECGIRIIAQPPGKKLQNMMQLSGGEKALTAIDICTNSHRTHSLSSLHTVAAQWLPLTGYMVSQCRRKVSLLWYR